MSRSSTGAVRRLIILGLGAALLGGGCGGRRLIPVVGKVLLADGAPATSGNLRYVPDKSKGNELPTEPIGSIGSDGTYQLTTDGKPGAPAGVYKVVVFINRPSNPKDMYSRPVSLIDKKYNAPETTDLTVEVTEKAAAGAYDLKLSP